MPVGGGEVVHIAGARQGHDLGVAQAAIRAQMPDDGLVSGAAYIPDRTVGGEARMGLERHTLQVIPQSDEIARRQVRRRQGQGRSRLPQRPDLIAGDHDGGVGGAGVVVRADAGARVALGAEARRNHGPQLRLRAALGRVGEPRLQRRLAVLDAEGAHHAVAVEPVGRRSTRPPELGRSVAIERALQPGRRPAVDQAHRPARDVAFDVLGRQRPVGLRRGDGVQGSGGAHHFGRGHGGREGGGAHQERTA